MWALEIGALGVLGALGYAHDLSTNLREIFHLQKQNQWDLLNLCELWKSEHSEYSEHSDMPHDLSTNLREIYHLQKQNQWDLLNLCELWKSEHSEHSDMPMTFLPNSVRFIVIKSKISEICGICVSQGHSPRLFHQPPWDLTSSKAKSVRSAGSVWALAPYKVWGRKKR